jgi:hypothetical protein
VSLVQLRVRVAQKLPRALSWLDVTHAAPIPIGAEPAATRRGEMIQEVGHRVVRTMRGDEVLARKRSPPLALAARDKYGLALFVGETIECLLNGKIGVPLSLASAAAPAARCRKFRRGSFILEPPSRFRSFDHHAGRDHASTTAAISEFPSGRNVRRRGSAGAVVRSRHHQSPRRSKG